MIDTKEEQIKLLAKQLRMPTFGEYKETLRQCSTDSDISDILLNLMQTEIATRLENQNKRRLKMANFPYLKTLDEFDFHQLNPSISHAFVNELASCDFVDNRRNIIMIGNPGRGKTHLSIALGLKACMKGFTVLFKNAASLSTELTEARDSYQLNRLENQIKKAQLLILDELSYISFNKYESELLFKVLSERSEKSSTIITTNLPFSKWTELFENSTMVSALVDRLTYKSFVMDMNGPSYRLLSSQNG